MLRYIIKIISIFIITVQFSYAQNIANVKLHWQNIKNSNVFAGAILDDYTGLALFYKKININHNNSILPFLQVLDETKLSSALPDSIINKLDYTYRIHSTYGIERKQAYGIVTILPYRKDSYNNIYQLNNFNINWNKKTEAQKISATTYTAHSVLSSGAFYKISITQTGIHRIDYELLSSMGMNVSGLSCDAIKLYGNGGAMLPLLNADPRADDLTENAIDIIDINNNGIFESEDFILFYAQGPDTWKWNSSKQKFEHINNIYTDVSYYFITSSVGIGLRMSTLGSSAIPTDTANNYNFYYVYENDLDNPSNGGQFFFGESFRSMSNFSKTFELPLTNYDSAIVDYNIGAISSVSNINFNTNINGHIFTNNIGYVSPGISYPVTAISYLQSNKIPYTNAVTLNMTASMPSEAAANAWLDFIRINARPTLAIMNGHTTFRDMSTVAAGANVNYQIANCNSSTRVYQVTNGTLPLKITGTLSGSFYSFTAEASQLHEYVAVNPESAIIPITQGPVANQDLHGIGQPDYVIITHPNFITQAERLAQHHRDNSDLDVIVVNIFEIYNEFSSGQQDAMAVRDFMKMLYDRAGSDEDLLPQYLLLFGDGSFDYKDVEKTVYSNFENTNFVPTYESSVTFDPLNNFVSDDLLACYDYNEGNPMSDINKLDVGIGRFTCRNINEAKSIVDKIIHYDTSPACMGSWRNKLVFWGDDEDYDQHMRYSEYLADTVKQNHPIYNINKIYLDAYNQIISPGGARYPDANKALMDNFYFGNLITNYYGHGSERRLTHEATFTLEDINSLNNINNMPLVITGTCDFSRFDDPNVFAAGEQLFMNPNGGAIAMMTTVRVVFSNENHGLVSSFYKNIFPTTTFTPALGDILRKGKNDFVASNIPNKRKFILYGDPALQLAYPDKNVITTSINSNTTTFGSDTLSALEKVTIRGEIRDNSGLLISDFNGYVYPTIYDKSINRSTLQNDIINPDPADAFIFDVQESVIFKGKASVIDGLFSFTFILPKDIALNIDKGKISYYASDNARDAGGVINTIMIGGISDTLSNDTKGPDVSIFFNDEKFVFGGMVNEDPLLIVKLFDENGINTAGAGIGHDLNAQLNNNSQLYYLLNPYYEADADDYKRGKIKYPLKDLPKGTYTIIVKAYDTYNNAGEGYSEFVVAENATLALQHVLNYPNPFTTHTNFWFEHNMPGVPLNVQIQIMNIDGRVVKTIQEIINTEGFRSDGLYWDGIDEYGRLLGRGTYIYKITVQPISGGTSAKSIEKLVLLR